MTELQDAINWVNMGPTVVGATKHITVLAKAARLVAYPDTKALRKFINSYGIYPYNMGDFVHGIVTALGAPEDE